MEKSVGSCSQTRGRRGVRSPEELSIGTHTSGFSSRLRKGEPLDLDGKVSYTQDVGNKIYHDIVSAFLCLKISVRGRILKPRLVNDTLEPIQ